MASLVFWKKKTSKYDEDNDDITGVKGPKLIGELHEAKFINGDSSNAKAMEKLGLKW